MKTSLKNLNNLFRLFSVCIVLLSVMACSDDDSSYDNVRIKAKATNSFSQSRNALSVVTTISDFKINIKEIELEYDDDFAETESETDMYIDSDDEIELQGPFEVNLMTGEFNITALELPEANFEEIEFEFDKNTDASSDLFNKTILIEGTIDGVPFVFWHDFEEEIEVDYEDETNDISVTSSLTEILINFDLDALLSQVDISVAMDGNQDGVIEISPVDADGNNDLADDLVDALESITELSDD